MIRVTKGKQTVIGLRSTDCLYHDVKHPNLGKSWSDLGIPDYAYANKLFVPNVSKLTKGHSSVIADLGKILKNYDDSQVRILTYILTETAKLKRFGLQFGQPVYINLSAPYIENLAAYYKARVVGVIGADRLVVLGNLHVDTENSTTISVDPENVLTQGKFVKLSKRLIKEKKTTLTDQEREKYLIPEKKHKIVSKDEYEALSEIPTLDSVPSSWFDSLGDFDKPQKNKAGKKKKTISHTSLDKLTDIMMQGKIVNKKLSINIDYNGD